MPPKKDMSNVLVEQLKALIIQNKDLKMKIKIKEDKMSKGEMGGPSETAKRIKQAIEKNKQLRYTKENFKRKLVTIDNKKDLLQEITKQLAPKEMEKKLLGEVFTPLDIVEEMLDTLPSNVWSNPDLKWLEPGSGLGNFTICVFYRLMDGLKKVIPDAAKRERHIIENMLYMAELNTANVHICKSIFKDKKNGNVVNLFQGDFLELDTKDTWVIDKFDIIIGNPPFSKVSDITKLSKGGNIIWPMFLRKSFDLLKTQGLLLFIHPSIWRKPNHKLHDILFKNQLLKLKIYNEEQTKTYFNIISRLDYYLLQKTPIYKSTYIIDEHRNETMIDLNNINFIPNFGINIFNCILNKLTPSNRFEVIGKSYELTYSKDNVKKGLLSHNMSIKYKYCNINSINAGGINYIYSLKPHSNYNKKKVIFSNGRYIYPIYDDGVCGMTQGGIAIVVNNKTDGDLLVKYLNSNIIKYIISATKWSNFETNWELFNLVPNPHIVHLTDINLYKYFGLNKDEIIEIEKTLGSRARHHSTPEELSMFLTSTPTHNGGYNTVKTIENLKVDKLDSSKIKLKYNYII
jgi:hypothetical protein